MALYEQNGFGLYDVGRNAAEWVADWYDVDYYSQSPVVDPQGPPVGDGTRVVRDAWDMYERFGVRLSERSSESPEYRSDRLGFRCVAQSFDR